MSGSALDVSVKFNNKPLTAFFQGKSELLNANIQKEFVLEANFFIGRIKKAWYSGRRADDMGLNRISGNLASRWDVLPIKEGGIKIISGMNYSEIHEKGLPNKRNIPKRSDVRGDWARDAKTIFMNAVNTAKRKTFK